MGVAHIVAAIGVGQGVTPLPAVSVVARLDPIIAVAGRIVIAAPGAAIIAEVRPPPPPVAVIAIPAISAAVVAPVAAVFTTVLPPVASIIPPIAAPFPAVLPVVPAIVPPVTPIVTTVLAPLEAIVAGLGLCGQRRGDGDQADGDGGGLHEGFHGDPLELRRDGNRGGKRLTMSPRSRL